MRNTLSHSELMHLNDTASEIIVDGTGVQVLVDWVDISKGSHHFVNINSLILLDDKFAGGSKVKMPYSKTTWEGTIRAKVDYVALLAPEPVVEIMDGLVNEYEDSIVNSSVESHITDTQLKTAVDNVRTGIVTDIHKIIDDKTAEIVELVFQKVMTQIRKEQSSHASLQLDPTTPLAKPKRPKKENLPKPDYYKGTMEDPIDSNFVILGKGTPVEMRFARSHIEDSKTALAHNYLFNLINCVYTKEQLHGFNWEGYTKFKSHKTKLALKEQSTVRALLVYLSAVYGQVDQHAIGIVVNRRLRQAKYRCSRGTPDQPLGSIENSV